MRTFACGLAALLLFSGNVHSQAPAPLDEIVKTEQGSLRGTPRDAQGVLSFKGVPFAAAPVGPLRWQAPQAAKLWEGTREATSFGNRCWANVRVASLAGRSGGVPQSEDCL